MEAGAAPLITIAPNVSLNFKTKADFNVDQPPAFLGFQGLNLSCVQLQRKSQNTQICYSKRHKQPDDKMEISLFGQQPQGPSVSFTAGSTCVNR